ncbi:hypothetical protein BC833DRAFT_655373 [Globomyces pollinis-pini]|nr:hypothetical protein BC833DRAFT_655373 [Globomyces pollinis-pini]
MVVADPKVKNNQGIILPLITFGSIGLFCVFLFCIVRKFFNDIYSPRTMLPRGRPPKISNRLLSWVWVVFSTSESFLVNTVGLDGVMLLRFFKLGYQFFFVLSLLGMGCLAPINYYSNEPVLPNSTWFKIEAVLLPALSIENVPQQSPLLKVILGFTWLISFIAYGFIMIYYRRFITLKLQYDEYALKRTQLSKIEMRTVMVFGIPQDLRSEVNLAVYFENLGIGKVDTVVLCRNWSLLQRAVEKRAYFLRQLELLYVKCKRIPREYDSARNLNEERLPFVQRNDEHERLCSEILSHFSNISPLRRPKHRIGMVSLFIVGLFGLFGPLVDSVEFYCAEFKHWDKTVARIRKTPEKSKATAVALVTFESPISATIVSQSVTHSDPFSLMTRMAPEPRDIYWPNLSSKSAHTYTKLVRTLIVLSTLSFLVFSSTFVVSSIAGLIDLEQLAKYLPFLKGMIDNLPPTTVQLIQGVIPAILLATWNACLPSVLLILCQLQGLEAESWIQQSLLTKYFGYMFYNVIFVIPFSSVAYEILLNPQNVIEQLGRMLPKSSSTLINIIILQAVAVYPAQLLLAAPLILTWLSRLAPWANSTPREISNAYYPSILTCINYGIIYPLPILVFVVGLMYSAIAPVILPFCTLFFLIGYFVYKYILLYVHIPMYESKGMATPYVVNRCLLGLFIMQLTMMGVLALKSVDDDNVRETSSEKAWSGYAQMVVGVAPLLFLTFFIANLLQQAYEKQIRNVPLEIIGEAQRHLLRTDFDIDSDNFTPYQPFSSVMNHRTTQDEPNGRELREIVTPVTGNPKLLNRLSTLSFSLLNRSPQREPEVHIELPTSSSSSVSSVEPQNSADAEKRYSAITILQTHAHSGPSPFHDPNEIDPVLDLPGYSYEGLNTNVTSSRFVETPMTRVPGVLDTAVGAAMLRYGEQDAAASPLELSSDDDDCQLYSYLHPALIGKLPMPWYDGEVFEDLRRDQSRHQRLLVDKLQSRQRLSVHEELIHQDTTTSTNVSQVRGFFDGLTSWIHLTVS